MDDNLQEKNKAKEEIIKIANEIINDQKNLIERCRLITKLIYKAGMEDDRIFDPIIAIESETDDIPLGDVRKLWDKDALKEKDKEIKEYETRNEQLIIDTCRNIVNKYSGLKN